MTASSGEYPVTSPVFPATPTGGDPAQRVFARSKGGRVQSIKDHDVPFPITTPFALEFSVDPELTYELDAAEVSVAVDDGALTIEVEPALTVDVDSGELQIEVELDLNC